MVTACYCFLVSRFMGHGCSTVVEQTPHIHEVVGLNPAGCWAFFLLLSFPTFLHQWSLLNQVTQGAASPTVCCGRKKKMVA